MRGSDGYGEGSRYHDGAPSYDDRRRVKPKPAPIKPVFRDDEEVGEISKELLDMYEQSFKEIDEGEIVTGRVVKVTESDILIDVGFKSEGVVSLGEFGDNPTVRVGDEIEVFLEKMENQDGLVVLSKQRADFL
ncbi:MAG: S1 RNA-binding domain-containing protein, partial [bacterium]